MKWRYKKVYDWWDVIDAGQQGWELVAVVAIDTTREFYLKRQDNDD